MEKILVVFENDFTLDRADYVKRFIEEYGEGEVIELTRLHTRSNSEIFAAVSKCTDIAVQTCFVNGSDYQLIDMVNLLGKVSNPINIYIKYLGLSNENELFEYLTDNITPEQFFKVEHHKIYAMCDSLFHFDDEPYEHELLDFSEITKAVHEENKRKEERIIFLQGYKETAKQRPTGRKIKVLGCTANGKAFQNLPIGEVVDELECNELLETSNPPRGVWIWGNGEPIMLVNDHGFKEYEIDGITLDDVIDTMLKKGGLLITDNKYHVIKSILLNGELGDTTKANLVCEELDIPKRDNRSYIVSLLGKINLEVSI